MVTAQVARVTSKDTVGVTLAIVISHTVLCHTVEAGPSVEPSAFAAGIGCDLSFLRRKERILDYRPAGEAPSVNKYVKKLFTKRF